MYLYFRSPHQCQTLYLQNIVHRNRGKYLDDVHFIYLDIEYLYVLSVLCIQK
jgi:hypothetical protein